MGKIYQAETQVLLPNVESKIALLRRLLGSPDDPAFVYKRIDRHTTGGLDEEEVLVIHSEKSSMDIERGPAVDADDNYSNFGGSYSGGGD